MKITMVFKNILFAAIAFSAPHLIADSVPVVFVVKDNTQSIAHHLYRSAATMVQAAVKTVHEHAGFLTYASTLYAFHKNGYRVDNLSNYRWLDAAIISLFVAPVVKTAAYYLIDTKAPVTSA